MDIQGKVFVVTGGGNGIGREVVLGLLGRGARVAAVDLSADGLAGTVSLAGPNGDRLTTHQVNVTDAEAVNALPQAVIDAHGSVDGLLNVAGIIQKFVPFAELNTSDIERVMNVNFWGPVNMVRAFLPHLVKRPTSAIVNVSSMGGFLPVPGQTIYGASKAAIKLFTEGLHAELMNGPVAVTVVFPGAIGTNIAQNSGVGIPGMDAADASSYKTLPPSEAGRIIIEGMAKGKYRVLVGSDATMLDRLTRLAPERAMKLIAKQMADLLKH
jgi:NAD(P)-dependent dehydrogenase (short-subunit alcohol dehydrogenase family)